MAAGDDVYSLHTGKRESDMKDRILVIEDNEQNLYLVKFILEKSGY